MKVYIAGKITGNPNYKEQFEKTEAMLKEQGHTTMNPAILPDGFDHHEYMKICFSMIDVCQAVYFQPTWVDSIGARMEYRYAREQNKVLIFGEV